MRKLRSVTARHLPFGPTAGDLHVRVVLSAQLGGAMALNWSREGLIATLHLNKGRLEA